MIAKTSIDHELCFSLLDWYVREKRDLPWRNTRDPWLILLSEVILQQTQVSRGILYWERISERFPTVKSMARSDVDELLLLWQGAGYYSRARRLHALAVIVSTDEAEGGYDGIIPREYEKLVKLPGIGPYTAAAVASIAFDTPVPVVDGNVNRVASRFMADPNPSLKAIRSWGQSLLHRDRPGDSNQALMELGALVCKPRKPKCESCPLSSKCSGRGNAESFPKRKKNRKKIEYIDALVMVDPSGLPFLTRRENNGRFGGLWGPPMGNVDTEANEKIGEISHQLSHRELRVSVWRGSCSEGIDPKSVPISNLDSKILAMVLGP